jgi:hypothetical protein
MNPSPSGAIGGPTELRSNYKPAARIVNEENLRFGHQGPELIVGELGFEKKSVANGLGGVLVGRFHGGNRRGIPLTGLQKYDFVSNALANSCGDAIAALRHAPLRMSKVNQDTDRNVRSLIPDDGICATRRWQNNPDCRGGGFTCLFLL